MWLLDANTRKLEYFINEREMHNKYAILSHTWEKDEVTFDNIQGDATTGKAGYQKILFTCEQVKKNKLDYAWVDTCEY